MIEQIQCDLVQAEVVTEVGHIAPVRFRLDGSLAEAPLDWQGLLEHDA
jgi:hypothetical protein